MTRTLALPLSGHVAGRNWQLYSFDFESPDGRPSGYIYATSFEHARLILADMQGAEIRIEQIEGQFNE